MRFGFVLFLLLAGLPGRPAAAGDAVELVVLHTSDVHAEAEAPTGGWLRLASVIAAERRRAGADHVLLLDGGDTISGSLLGTIAQGETDLAMLRYLGYDTWTPGNHELDFGPARLRTLLAGAPLPVLAGNLRLPDLPALPAYRLVTKAGLRVAVMGMTHPGTTHWSWLAAGARDLGGAPAVPVLERLLPAVQRQQPDVIVLVIHQGYREREPGPGSEVAALAARFPQIDLILGGHTHRAFAGRRLGHSYYVQPGAHGEYVARATLRVDPAAHQVLGIESVLLPAAAAAPDPEARRLLQPWLDRAAAFGARPVATLPAAVTASGRPGRDCAMSELLARALAWRAGAPVAFHGCLSAAAWRPGRLTEADLFRAVPYENHLAVLRLTPRELQQVLAEQLRWAGTDAFNGPWGYRARVDLGAAQVLAAVPPPAAADGRVAVAFNTHAVTGGGGRFPVLLALARQPACALRLGAANTRDILRDYLQADPAAAVAPPTAWLELARPAAAAPAAISP